MLSQVSSNVEQQSEDLIQILLRNDFYSKDKIVQNHVEISNAVTVMTDTYATRILLLRGNDVIFDSQQYNGSSIVSNHVIDSADNLLESSDFSALNDAFSSQFQ